MFATSLFDFFTWVKPKDQETEKLMEQVMTRIYKDYDQRWLKALEFAPKELIQDASFILDCVKQDEEVSLYLCNNDTFTWNSEMVLECSKRWGCVNQRLFYKFLEAWFGSQHANSISFDKVERLFQYLKSLRLEFD